jgi:hypothetical protein
MAHGSFIVSAFLHPLSCSTYRGGLGFENICPYSVTAWMTGMLYWSVMCYFIRNYGNSVYTAVMSYRHHRYRYRYRYRY